MDTTERQVIDELFGKVRQAEQQSGPRDAEAEAYIRDQVSRQPAAPYYMSQAIVIQEQALAAAQARIEQLEAEASQKSSGGFLGGLFGGPKPAAPMHRRGGSPVDPRIAQYSNPHGRHGGGFLGGAMQTAMGVAGGLLLGSAIMSMFADPAAAAEPAAEEPAPEEEMDMGMDEEF